jgi:hypothetical protein
MTPMKNDRAKTCDRSIFRGGLSLGSHISAPINMPSVVARPVAWGYGNGAFLADDISRVNCSCRFSSIRCNEALAEKFLNSDHTITARSRGKGTLTEAIPAAAAP